MAHKHFKTALAVVVAGVATLSQAQTTYVRPQYQYPEVAPTGGVQLGDSPFFAIPYLGAGLGYDDNLFFTPSNEKDSYLWVLGPGVRVDGRDRNKVIQLSWQNQIGRYTSSPDDNYVDNTARAQFDMAFDAHNFLRVGYDFILAHEPRGSTDRPFGGRPDRYRQAGPVFTYALGAPGAKGRIELYYSDPIRHYLNNRDFTTASDRNVPEYGGAFYFRVGPRTYVMAEARQTDVRYEEPGSPLTADERRYYAGITWEATAATTGTIKVGQLRRDPQNTDEPTFTGTSWEGLISWAPRSYSKFDLYSARQTNESTGLGNFILTSIAGLAWTHGWSSFITTSIDARYQKDDYKGFDRTDKYKVLGLRAGYKFRRWLTVGAEYTHTTRDSNIDTFEYDRNLYLITLTASM